MVQAGSSAAQVIEQRLSEAYNVSLISQDKFTALTSKKGQLSAQDVDRHVFTSSIEELLFSTTGLDASLERGVNLAKPLLFEVKSVKNVSKPFQRVKDPDLGDLEPKEMKIGPKKGQTYQLIGHDGVRFIKLVLLFREQTPIVSKINEVNKFILAAGIYVSRADGQSSFLVDSADQITCIYNDKSSPKLGESTMDIKGLPVRATGAPKFVFLNDRGSKAEKIEPTEEIDDEYADLFHKFDVPDLAAHERTYINRFQQIGFWRKKFPVEREGGPNTTAATATQQ